MLKHPNLPTIEFPHSPTFTLDTAKRSIEINFKISFFGLSSGAIFVFNVHVMPLLIMLLYALEKMRLKLIVIYALELLVTKMVS